MDEPRKHQVSLRGASAKEITREALIEKVSREREIRNYARRSNAAAILIQRVWRSYLDAKMTSLRLLDEWERLLKHCNGELTSTWISITVLRPFLLFSVHLLRLRRDLSIRTRILDSAQICFTILLESMNRPGLDKQVLNLELLDFFSRLQNDWLSLSILDIQGNFCSLAIGTPEERRLWNFQARKLISLCFYLLSEFNLLNSRGQDIVGVTSQAMRLAVVLTDCKGWKIISDANSSHAENAVKNLISFLGSNTCGMYKCIGRYVSRLDTSSSSTKKIIPRDDNFFITASVITLALRPFYVTKGNGKGSAQLGIYHAAEQYFVFLLTIPQLTQRLPAVLVPALKHDSTLSPCFQTLLISKEKILMEMNQSKTLYHLGLIPPVGWALANVICLATSSESDSIHGCFNQSIDYTLYVHVVIMLAESLLAYLDIKCMRKQKKISLHGDETGIASSTPESPTLEHIEAVLLEKEAVNRSLNMAYIDLCRPVCQQWHLSKLLDIANNSYNKKSEAQLQDDLKALRKLELHDIALFYSVMLRIFSTLHPTLGSLPVLNMLSFTPGFLFNIWQVLETFIFPAHSQMTEDHFRMHQQQGNIKNTVVENKPKQVGKDGVNKWASVLNRLTGKPHADIEYATIVDNKPGPSYAVEESSDVWDVEAVKYGLQGISKDILCMLHLFCAAYSHLLLVLDDIEFYEKQIPFKLEQQRRIAAMLNTLVYNGLLSHGNDQHQPLLDSAIRCLHLMYERDCRHQFCPADLWLSPASKSRPPIAVAARTHGLLSTNMKPEEALTTPSMGSVITTTPHIFPFEERVEMFREFIKMDKASRKMAGEILEPGSRSIEVVVRRGHIVEDGFRQLNPLGSRLKSSIHISFVSECGLPEAGLDYGGLSKEFLTDISKTAFAPEYGLFSQTSSSDRLLIPNPSARYIENGIQMIEFLGRVVGKALYEGILLDYSFSHVFVQKLLGRYSFLDELSTLDPELYRNLMYVKYYDGDVTDLSLDFTVTAESFGKRHIIELKTGGKDVSVTNENKMQYIHAMADYKLNQQILPFSNAFYRGLTDLISVSWLRLFNASEFNQLLSGGNYDIDVDDLKTYTRYTGGYNESSRTIKIFWEVIRDFEPKERCLLLKFVTSCSRAPLLGFKHLQPSFTIHKVACDIPLWATFGGQDVERLPSASTCYNTLKLPTYKRSSTLRSKLLYAINSNAGFELS